MRPWSSAAVACVLAIALSASLITICPWASQHSAPEPGAVSVLASLTVREDPAAFAELERQVASMHVSPSVASAIVGHVGSESLAEIQQQAQFRTLDNCGFLPVSCPVLAGFPGTFLGGCAVGAVLGAPAAGVGAGVGCVVGGLAAEISYGIGVYIASASQSAPANNYKAWEQAMMASFGNEENLTATAYANLASALNFSEIGFQRMADNAALLQLNHSSFSVPLDLVQSGIAAQMGAIAWAYQRQVTEAVPPVEAWLNSQSASGAIYASNCLGFQLGRTGSSGQYTYQYDAGAASSAPAYYMGPGITGSGAFDVYIPGSTNVTIAAMAAQVVTIHAQSYENPSYWWNTSTTMPGVSGASYATITSPPAAAAYNVTMSWNGQGTPVLLLSSGTRLPSSANTPLGLLRAETAFQAGSGSCSGSNGPSNWIWAQNSTLAMICTNTCGQGTTPTATYAVFAGAAGQNFLTWLGHLEDEAAINANAYWSFLKSLGYNSISSVPANCIIPAPYQVLPSNLNLGNLSVAQLTSLYQVWLQGLGNFYNVSLSGTQFCGQQGHRFNLGNVTWGDWAEQAIGYVYIANSTGTYSYNGAPLPTEKFANLSTWAITSTHMVLMPTLSQISVPVGQRWAVPADDPVWVYVYDTVGYCAPGNTTPACSGATAHLLSLSGNGSSSATCSKGAFFCPQGRLVPLSLTAGSSLYLTSCTINGAAVSNCTVGPQNITVVVHNLTCPGGQGSCSPPSGGGGFTFGNPFEALACFLLALLGGCSSGLGAELASVLAFIIILAIVGLGLYAVYVVLSNRRGRGDGGNR